jgi:hypothetical protein
MLTASGLKPAMQQRSVRGVADNMDIYEIP